MQQNGDDASPLPHSFKLFGTDAGPCSASQSPGHLGLSSVRGRSCLCRAVGMDSAFHLASVALGGECRLV